MNINRTNKFRILMLAEKYPPVYSGAGHQAYSLSKTLAKLGHQVIVLTQLQRGLAKKENQDGFQVVRLKSIGGRVLFSYLFGIKAGLWLLFRWKRFDILHIHGINLWGLPAMLIARLTGIKIVAKMTLLGEDDPPGLEKMKFGKLRKKVYLFPHKVIALTQAQIEQYRQSEFADHKLVQIPNGVDLKRYFPVSAAAKMELRKKLNLPADKNIALFVGKISVRKGVPVLIDAWSNFLQNENIMLCLVGPDNIEKEFSHQIRIQIKEKNLENQIIMAGNKKNIAEYMQAADLFVLPSEREGLPNSLLEAMACGLPCIVAAMPEYETIFRSDPPVLKMIHEINSAKLAAAILELMDLKMKSAIGSGAHQFIASHLSIEKIAGQYEKLYGQLIHKKQ
ncbi:MAG: glycosyltransferase family 4 protein [candidate division KSB1 bacterium]|nr:glycosyltransferase family 4 protein [candidate division KSB1 bacterium]